MFRTHLILFTLFASAPAFAQEPPAQEPPAQGNPAEGAAPAEGTGQGADPDDAVAATPDLPWKLEGKVALGERAHLVVPKGLAFLGKDGAPKLLERMGNLTSNSELGLIGPRDLAWFVVYYFDDIGYVKDDEKNDLDAPKLLKELQESVESGNEERKSRGLETLEITGWAMAPRFNDTTKALEWATLLKSESGDVSVNYETRVLGREGVMNVIVATDPKLLDETLPKYQDLMKGFNFVEGQRYAEYRDGDKIAEFGLSALILGGATAVAAKTGLLTGLFVLLKKGGKLVVLAAVFLAGAAKTLISKVTGKKQ